MATIRMADPEGRHVTDPPFFIGDEIEIQLGDIASSSPSSVFIGEIVTFEPEFTNASATICVRAYDKSHRLHRNRRSATFQDMTLSDVVQKIVGDNGAPGRHDRLDADGPPLPAAEHGVRPRLHQPAGRARELRVRRLRGPRVPAAAAQRRRRGAEARLARERQVVQAAHERGAAARQGQGHELRPGEPGGGGRRGHPARRDPAPRAGGARRRAGVRRLGAARLGPRREHRGGGAHDRPEHARQAGERLVRGRGHDGGRPRRQGGRQAQARGLRAGSTASTTSRRSRTSTGTATSARASRSAAATRAR